MTKLMYVLAALSFSAGGCKKNDPVAKMEGYEKAMCACKDKACAEKVALDVASWKLDAAKANKPIDSSDPKMLDFTMKYADCGAKLMDHVTTASATASADPAGASAGNCPAGFTHAQSFCIKLPPGVSGNGGTGMVVGDGHSKQYGWAGGDKGSDFGITVIVSPKNEFYDATVEDVKKPTYQGKAIADGKIGDTGAWGSGEDGPPPAGYAQRHYLKAVNRSDKEQLTCDITRASGTAAPSEDQVFEACKTIQFAL